MDNNKKIYFIRHGKLLLPYKNHSDMPMHVLASLASKKIGPSIDSLFLKKNINKLSRLIPLNGLDIIYVSPSRRCKETAKFIKDYIERKNNKKVSVITFLEVKEVKFDLYKIYKNKKEFNFKNLNDDVFRAMITGINSEPVKIVQARINKFMHKIKKNKNKKILVISHDFVMRIIEIYIKNNGQKKDIAYADLKNTQKNDYLNGFSVDRNFRKITPVTF